MFVHNSLKKYLAPALNPIARNLYALGITPNRATIISIIFKICSVALIASNRFWLATVSILLDYFFDTLDGTIARAFQLETRTGLYLDMSSDAILRLLWYPALVWAQSISMPLALTEVVIILILFGLSLYIHWFEVETRIPVFFLSQAILIPGFVFNQVDFFSKVVLVVHGYFILHNLVAIFFFRNSRLGK